MSLDNFASAQSAIGTDERICWICYNSDTEAAKSEWRSPCLCTGSTRWGHESCLMRWIDEKQSGNINLEVACPQCGFVYLIIYPKSVALWQWGQRLKGFIKRFCPFLMGGIFVIGVYWDLCTFGIITVLQMMGIERGMQLLTSWHPMLILVVMPAIPYLLIVVHCIDWELLVLNLIGLLQQPAVYLHLIAPRESYVSMDREQYHNAAFDEQRNPHGVDMVSGTNIICGAMMLPTCAMIIGRLCFASIKEPLKRNLLGAAVFLAGRAVFYIFFTKAKMRHQGRLLDFVPDS